MSIDLSLVIVLLVAHFVGDFICQSDWMALNKSKQWDALLAHVLVYAGALLATLGVSFALIGSGPTAGAVFVWLVVNSAAHFVQDAITSRINARLWQANERHWFFVGIGADQLLHYVTLIVTASWWLV